MSPWTKNTRPAARTPRVILCFRPQLLQNEKVLASLKRPNSRGSTIKEKSSKISETTGRQKWHQKGPTLEEAQINFFKSAENVFKKDEEPIVTTNKENKENVSSYGNNHFAKFITAELDQLPKKIQRIARYEIANALYNVQNRADQHQENVQTRQRSNQLYVQGPIDQQQYVHSQQQYPFNQRYKNLEQQQGDPSHLFQNIRMDGTNTPLHTLMHSLSPQVTPRQEMAVRQFIPQQLSGFNNPPSVQPQDASEEACFQSSHTNSSCAAESSQIGSSEFLPALGM